MIETYGQRYERLAVEYTDMSKKILDQKTMMCEVRDSPRFPEDPEFLLPAMQKDLDYMVIQRDSMMKKMCDPKTYEDCVG